MVIIDQEAINLNNKKFYSIGDVSAICNVPIKTLRYYDEIKLLVPQNRNPESNYRYYCENQLLTLFIIRKLKLLGFSLNETKDLINTNELSILERIVSQKLIDILKKIEAMKIQHTEGCHLLERISKGNSILNYSGEDARRDFNMPENEKIVLIEHIPLVDVIYTRKTQKNYNNADVSIDRWFEIFNMAAQYKLTPVGAITLTYHNQPFEQFYKGECDLEISIQVDRMMKGQEFKKFGGYQAASIFHVGSHSTIINAHVKAIGWINQNGYKINGPISEEYIISPTDVRYEERYLSKIIIPVEKI